MTRRISGLLAAVAAVAALVLAPVTPAQAAAPELEILNAWLTNLHQPEPDLYVIGTYTCEEPTGQAEIFLFGIQIIGGTGSAGGYVTIQCEDGPVAWEDEFDGYGLHPGFIMIHGHANQDDELQHLTSESFTLY